MPAPYSAAVDAHPDGTLNLVGIGTGAYHVGALACRDDLAQYWFTDIRGRDYAGRPLHLALVRNRQR